MQVVPLCPSLWRVFHYSYFYVFCKALEPNLRATELFKWLGLVGGASGRGRGGGRGRQLTSSSNTLPPNVAAWLQRATRYTLSLCSPRSKGEEKRNAAVEQLQSSILSVLYFLDIP